MSARIRIVKRGGRWFTIGRGQSQDHPTFLLAIAHARHLIHGNQRTLTVEHIATRVRDLIAWGWTIETIADESGVAESVIADLASLPDEQLQRLRISESISQSVALTYRKGATS